MNIKKLLAALGFSFLLFACSTEKKPDLQSASFLPFTVLDLDNLDAFQTAQAGDWKIANGIYMSRRESEKIQPGDGKGILYSNTVPGKSTHITTKLTHADMDIELDFMISKGAQPAIWLQSKYKISLKDSWRLEALMAADCGGIAVSSNQDSAGVPSINASKAPGLWQHLYVSFKAARFDAAGNKTADAIFEKVILNGKLIQEHLTMPSLSKGSFVPDEKGNAPLAFSNEGGAVAFKNIRYKAYEAKLVTLSNMRFEVYKGLYKNYDTLKNFTPYKKGTTDSLTWRVGEKRAELVIAGDMNIITEGNYLFKIRGGGAAALVVDAKEVVNNQGTREYTAATFGAVHLTPGVHPFSLFHANYDECLVLEYEGPGIPFTTLTTPASERKVKAAEPMIFPVGASPVMQRGFLMHHNKVDPYVVTTGFPGGLNYAYDLTTYNLLSAWRGKYVDVSNMWHDRGESQLQIPLGAAVEFDGWPSLFNTDSDPGNWPDSTIVDDNMYANRGYRIDSVGVPVFFYEYRGGKIEDKITSEKDGLIRRITYSKTTGNGQPGFLLASGSMIEKLPDGTYAIDDKEFYVEFPPNANEKNVIITKFKNGRYGLIWKVGEEAMQTMQYSLIW